LADEDVVFPHRFAGGTLFFRRHGGCSCVAHEHDSLPGLFRMRFRRRGPRRDRCAGALVRARRRPPVTTIDASSFLLEPLPQAPAPQPQPRAPSLVGRYENGVVEAVVEGLLSPPRSLPSWLLPRETAHPSTLPPGHPLRLEQGVLDDDAADIARFVGSSGRVTLVELGAGAGVRCDALVEALVAQNVVVELVKAAAVGVDADVAALDADVARAAAAHPAVGVRALAGSHDDVFKGVAAIPGPRCVLWLGAAVNRFDEGAAGDVLRAINDCLQPGNWLLLGADRRAGVGPDDRGTLPPLHQHILQRLNQEAGAQFDVDAWKTVVTFDPEASRVAAQLVAVKDQSVAIDSLGLSVRFKRGERIHAGASHRWSDDTVATLLEDAGFARDVLFVDAREHVGLHLARVQS
jgi:L-histidine N-alpha-methyltransferase